MGFKKGWAEYKKSKRSTARKRKTSAGKKKAGKKSSRSYTKASNPSGGRKMDKIGALLQKEKIIQDIAMPAIGTSYLGGTWEDKAKNAVRRYTGIDIDTGATNIDWAIPSYQGIATTLIEDFVDRRTRHAGRLSRGYIMDWIEEALPKLRAHADASGTFNYGLNFLNYDTKYRNGYDGGSHTWDLSRAQDYLLVKGLRIALQTFGKPLTRRINKVLPKNINFA